MLAYGVAYLVFGYLTTATSFLVSFVMGNGTNYAIVLLARYDEQPPAGPSAADAALRGLRSPSGAAPAWPPSPRRSATCR